MNPNVLASYALLSKLADSGVTNAVISPGSRSTPLAYVAHELFDTTVVIDERDAGFVALGISESTDIPAVVITTSGSAPTHLYPSVVEAFHSSIPMIVISSDRPHEVRGRGAPQTIDQTNLYGSAVRYFCDAKCPHDIDDDWYWDEIATSLIVNSQGIDGLAGPVHLNMGMREPLSPDGDERAELEKLFGKVRPGRESISEVKGSWKLVKSSGQQKAKTLFNKELLKLLENAKNACITIGRNALLAADDIDPLVNTGQWAVLCDVTSNLRDIEGVITSYDAVLRFEDAKDYLPDVVIQIGDPLTSKIWNEMISTSQVVSIKPREDGLDPYGNIDHKLITLEFCEAVSMLPAIAKKADMGFKKNWLKANALSTKLAEELAASKPNSEPALFLELGDMLKDINNPISILVASSMPIRYAEWFWNKTSKNSTIYSHRGTNGIDGMLSSVYGITHGSKQPTLCVIGDVALAHDIGFLTRSAQLTEKNRECVVLFVVDNGGGAIFRHLDQAKNATLASSYEEILQTNPDIDIEAITKASRSSYFCGEISQCVSIAKELLESGSAGTHLVHVKVDHESGPEYMQAYREKLGSPIG